MTKVKQWRAGVVGGCGGALLDIVATQAVLDHARSTVRAMVVAAAGWARLMIRSSHDEGQG